MDNRLVVVTATASQERFEQFDAALARYARRMPPIVAVAQALPRKHLLAIEHGVVVSSRDYLGVVPAFARGVEMALRAYPEAEVIACLHDDCLLQEPNWDEQLLHHFDVFHGCGLAGFGGAWGLGDEQAGQGEYRPTWLVRRGFMSNMRDAEAHGTRVLESRRVAVLDGFSLCFRRQFLQGWEQRQDEPNNMARHWTADPYSSLFAVLERWGVVHHAYDAAMGALAKDLGWETWLLPFACHHMGGQTAVGDDKYAAWAKVQRPAPAPDRANESGDQQFWIEAHRIVWQKLGHLLPFEVDRP